MVTWDVICVAGALFVLVLVMASRFLSMASEESEDDCLDANPARRSLTGRIVLCVDCDCKRILRINSSGRLVCSACGSEYWQHIRAAILPACAWTHADRPVRTLRAEVEELERIYELPQTRAQWMEGLRMRALARVEKANRGKKGGLV